MGERAHELTPRRQGACKPKDHTTATLWKQPIESCTRLVQLFPEPPPCSQSRNGEHGGGEKSHA